MKKILILEDDIKIRRILQLELEHEGYEVVQAKDGIEGLEKFKNEYFDLILLDLMMPNLSGEEVCKKIRSTSQIPIIVLTAKEQLLSKVSLLDMGADDYITKPFEIEELFARMRVALRNKKTYITEDLITYENLKINKELKKFYKNDEEIVLTKREYALLEYFMLNKEIVVSREKILENVWGYDFDGDEKIIDVYVNILRKKIESENEKYIHSVRGFGYIFKKKGA
ncbi:response regulator transcription factor [Fusobacterium hominis]|uniref:Response regulator transcription factor n=1 Tax=Fusobacterium hominis TaxID=2764326 RepID=A0A7G9GV28_9FUSO|nr:response regulator transcription factor [Fusobacterium hominis]QNM14660.1 response regulator transcription factor [Fusobacterium hominis]